jgi:DMSO/TMAO reductase YedYZ molybdopterin-dependent catalytic subunit
MALFIVRHEHEAERCPATNFEAGASLLNYLSRPSVRQHGVEIRGEAVVQGEHTLYMIVEADTEARVQEFMAPFSGAGTVDVYPASTCAAVVASGGCAAPAPVVDDVVPAVDPEEACQRAIEAGLVVHRAHPLNCETSIPALIGGVVMPSAHFYVRNHFQIPRFDESTWRLEVGGLVDRPLHLTLRDLKNMPSQTSVVTLECAGNGRSLFDPAVPGEVWGLGAVSTAEWTGVPLSEVLDRAGVRSGATDLTFQGADGGPVEGLDTPIRYERGLSLDQAREAGALLAYEMNGEALSAPHGYPLRLIVPGWYAVASVKWLTRITVADQPFEGHYQTDKYLYEWVRNGRDEREPVALMNVRALIAEPDPGARMPSGETALRGVAWSGAGSIARVEVSLNGGPWREARLVGEPRRGAWQWWELITRIDQPGPLAVRARATDAAGRTQPERAEWNRLGYGNNSIHAVTAQVV